MATLTPTTVQPQDPANIEQVNTNPQNQAPQTPVVTTTVVHQQDTLNTGNTGQDTQDAQGALDSLREFINSMFQTVYDRAVSLVRLVTCGIICGEQTQGNEQSAPVENGAEPVNQTQTQTQEPVNQTQTQTQEPANQTQTQTQEPVNQTQPVVQQTAEQIFNSINSETNTYTKVLSLSTQLIEASDSEEFVKTLLKIERNGDGNTIESGPFSLQFKFAVAFKVFAIEQANGNAVDGEMFIQNNPRHPSVKAALNDAFLALPQTVYTTNRAIIDDGAASNEAKFEALKNLINLDLNANYPEFNGHQIGDATFTEADLKAGINAAIEKLDAKTETAVIVSHLVGAYQAIVNATDISAAKAQFLADVRNDQVKQAAQNAPALPQQPVNA